MRIILNAAQLFVAIGLLIAMTWGLTKVVEVIVRRLAPWLPRWGDTKAQVGSTAPVAG